MGILALLNAAEKRNCSSTQNIKHFLGNHFILSTQEALINESEKVDQGGIYNVGDWGVVLGFKRGLRCGWFSLLQSSLLELLKLMQLQTDQCKERKDQTFQERSARFLP